MTDYGYNNDQHYFTPQPRARKSAARRLSLGSKKKFQTPSSPLSTSKQNMTHVNMLGDMAGDITPTHSPTHSPVQHHHQVPQTTGGIRRKLKLGGLRASLHGSGRHDHGDDSSVMSGGRSVGKSFTPKGLKKKLGRGLMKLKSERNVQEPGDLEFLDHSDHSQASHFTGGGKSKASTADAETASVASGRKLKKKSSSVVEDDDDEQSTAGTVVSKSGRRRRKKKKKDAAGEEEEDDDDAQSAADTIVSKSGRRRKKKKNINMVEDSPGAGSVSSKKKLKGRKSRRATAGDDVSVSSKGKRRTGKSSKPKTKINAWGEEVEEVSDDDTYANSLYGDDGSTSKPRRRRRKKKNKSIDSETGKPVTASELLRSNHSKDSTEVEKRRLALEQELDAMLDLSNHKLDHLEDALLKDEQQLPIPPPPPLNSSPAGPDDYLMPVPPVPPVNPNAKRRSQSGFTSYEHIRSPNSSMSDLKSPVNTYAPHKEQSVEPSKGEYSRSLKDDDDDIQSQEEEEEDRPPIQSLTFSQRTGRRTVPIEAEQELTQHTTYEYALGDTTSDEEGEFVSSSKRKSLRDGSQRSASKRSNGSNRSPRFQTRKEAAPVVADDASAGGMSASSLRRRNAKKDQKKDLNKKMDSMLNQLEKYESNLEEEHKKLRKKIDNLTIEKEYLAQRNRQLEFKIEELKDKAAEDADQLIHATRNRNQSSEELESLRIENEILKEKLQRHEDSLLRMNTGAKSVRGIRSAIKGVDDPDKYDKELAEKDKEIAKLKADLGLMRDQLRYKSEDYDKQAVELHQARKEVAEARHTLKHTGTFKYHNRFEEMKQEKVKNKSKNEVALSSFFDD